MSRSQYNIVSIAKDHGFKAVPWLDEETVTIHIPWVRGEERGEDTVQVRTISELREALGY